MHPFSQIMFQSNLGNGSKDRRVHTDKCQPVYVKELFESLCQEIVCKPAMALTDKCIVVYGMQAHSGQLIGGPELKPNVASGMQAHSGQLKGGLELKHNVASWNN